MDLSLDEIIQSKRKVNRPRQNANFPIRGGRINKRNSAPLSLPRAWNNNNNNKPWQHDMFRGNRNFNGNNQQQNTRTGNGTKIQISNLDFGVNNEDINELFKEFGNIIKAGVHYDRSGRSLGTAEVTYVNKTSAIMARNKYNGIPLDNKPMKIMLIEQNSFNRGFGDRLTMPVQRPRMTNVRRPPTRPFGDARPRPIGKRNKKESKTKEQLDAEMDDYVKKID